MGFGITIILLIILWILYEISKKDSEEDTYEDDYYEHDDYDKKLNLIPVDSNGYERDGFGKLIHRKVAFKHLYSYPKYPKRFGSYDIHHIDGNKKK